MAIYRESLPQCLNGLFLTDSGLETRLIFEDGYQLDQFAVFVLLTNTKDRLRLKRYYIEHALLAIKYHCHFILESVTWRASADWAKKLGINLQELDSLNKQSIQLLEEVRSQFATPNNKFIISACIGPRGDGYQISTKMNEQQAFDYHKVQIQSFVNTQADMVSALTINYVQEAIGIVKAAQFYNMPVVISFTLETDGLLPSGQSLKEAILQVDKSTSNGPLYYMINCAHPTHFEQVLIAGEKWPTRIKGIRANASCKSHQELDESDVLDIGDPYELGQQYKKLLTNFKHINILGGCCGTDIRHIEQIAKACQG
ncbi:MAG: homocysteine S-methyltransferase family protein [Saccharospirillaceae bacterium]|nr:homocysteine S-methyltransferase family protein [Pseudomonadales bacterium]NRB81123.1 homocysteine S-methyltransferase family protein [Saccharospirillaceae bacterium]